MLKAPVFGRFLPGTGIAFYGWKIKRPFHENHREGRTRMEGVKIYGLCLERLRYQITNARKRVGSEGPEYPERVLMESYNTGETDEIIDILELYDIEDRTPDIVREKLEDLAYTVSELVRETVLFDYTDEGHLGLYLALPKESAVSLYEAAMAG
jgi:hypothetical protein